MKLIKYMEINKKTIRQVANELNFSYEDIRRYIRELAIPRLCRMKKIEKWSRGKVTPNDFYNTGESK